MCGKQKACEESQEYVINVERVYFICRAAFSHTQEDLDKDREYFWTQFCIAIKCCLTSKLSVESKSLHTVWKKIKKTKKHMIFFVHISVLSNYILLIRLFILLLVASRIHPLIFSSPIFSWMGYLHKHFSIINTMVPLLRAIIAMA